MREAFLRLGEAAEEFLVGLNNTHPRNCGHHARLILQLKENYISDDIERACAHAIRYRAFDAKDVERIVKAHATPRTLESTRNERARRVLEKSLPKIKQRPLEEYSHMFREDKKDET